MYLCVRGIMYLCVRGIMYFCVRVSCISVLGVSILPLFIYFFDKSLELFRQCGIMFFSFSCATDKLLTL